MRILVTGGAGYIGSVTTEMLLDAGHEVTVFDNFERGHRSAIDVRANVEEGDLRNRTRIAEAMAVIKPDAVMHFAAYALVGESMEVPETYFQNNLVGGLNLVDAMLVSGCKKIVFSSTCATYGQPDRVPITEEEMQKPENPYGESKLALEKALRWYEELRGIKAVFLRYFNACGATAKFGEDHDPETHLIPIILQVALGKREEVQIFGDDYETPDGTCLRDYIHIVDLSRAHILALTGDHSGPFNLGNGTGYSVKDVIETARRVTGHPIPARVAARRPGDPARLIASAQKAHDVLGWRPGLDDLESIIKSAWDWHQEHPEGYGD
ncbi:MAG: UDP-glucose 4-epimerase GalE [Kiritimatiellia bacterium]|nr:UDP-glucose 4-epimerase GalE [Kiritimatiellia bacterium]